MAVKASSQVTLVDLTDAYGVVVGSEAHVFMGDTDSVKSTQTTSFMVSAMRGSEQVPCTVGKITCPTGISAVSDGKSPSPTITVTATTALKSGGALDIPVTIDGGIVIHKTFSYSIAFTGATGATGDKGDKGEQGQKGDKGDAGADAITIVISSSGGLIFKNTDIATTLTAHVYRGGAEITGSALTALGTIKWYKDGSQSAIATGQTLTIDAGDVQSRASYVAQLEA